MEKNHLQSGSSSVFDQTGIRRRTQAAAFMMHWEITEISANTDAVSMCVCPEKGPILPIIHSAGCLLIIMWVLGDDVLADVSAGSHHNVNVSAAFRRIYTTVSQIVSADKGLFVALRLAEVNLEAAQAGVLMHFEMM